MVLATIKKGLILGLALAKLTKDEAAGTVKFLVKEGGVSQKQGRKLLKDVLKQSEKEKQRLKKAIKQKMLTDKELSMLRKEVSHLRKDVRSSLRTGRKVAGSAYRRLRK